MAISIKNREAESLLQEIRAATHRGTSQIVLELLRHEAARLRRSRQYESRRHKLEQISERYARRLPTSTLTPEEIIGYDENGLPR